MEAKEDLRIVRTRKLLSNTLLEMMEEASIEKISVIDLCNRAMVNRATFYTHFEDKYHLLSYALEELKDEVYANFTCEFEATCPKEMYRKLIHMAFEFIKDKKNHVANVLHNNRNEKVIHTITDSLAQSIRYQLAKFKDTHPSVVPVLITSQCFAGAMVSLAVWCIDNPERFSHDELSYYLNALIDENFK